jgi:MFS family permease
MFALTPVFGKQAMLSTSEIGWLMIAMVLGGAALQLPAGYISDRYDRRKVMAGITFLGIATASVGILVEQPPTWAIFCLYFVLGGCCIAIYPLCLAHANDRYPGHFLLVGTVILLVNGAGSVIGPTTGALMMNWQGATGFLLYIACGLFLSLLWMLFWLIKHRDSPDHTSPFVGTAKSTQALMEIDPRIDDGEKIDL